MTPREALAQAVEAMRALIGAADEAKRSLGGVIEGASHEPWTHPTLGLQDPNGVHGAYGRIVGALRVARDAYSAAEAVLATPERDAAAEERVVAFIRHEWPDSDTAYRIAASIERGEHRKPPTEAR